VKEKDLHAVNLLEEYLAAIEKEKQDNEASPGDQAKGRRGARATLPATPPVGHRSNSNPNWSPFEFQPRLTDLIRARV